MATNENLIPIPGRLHSVATEGHVAGADEIFDDSLNKDQATINQEINEAIGTGGSVDSRISAAINALDSSKSQSAGADGLALSVVEENGKITSISGSIAANTYDDYGAASAAQSAAISAAATDATTKVNAAKSEIKGTATSACDTLGEAETLISAEATRAQAAESALSSGKADKATTLAGYGITDAYTKSETYTKTEVNGLVDTPHQEYVTVDAYASLPATGSKDTIYRVSNYNGSTSQVDASVYSEYAWNGSQYIFLCVKSQIGEVFDISVYNNNAKYADLAAALNGGANIPQSLQKGGMSVKFVQSSDNKYVQYRLMADTFNTTPSNWQGVDDEPIAGSDNLVKSGGVKDFFEKYKVSINIIPAPNINTTDRTLEFGQDSIFYVGGKSYELPNSISLDGVNSGWSLLFFNLDNQQFIYGAYSDFPYVMRYGNRILVGIIIKGYDSEGRFKNFQYASFPFTIKIDGKFEYERNSQDIANLKIGKNDAGILDNNKVSYFKNLFQQSNWASRNGGTTPHTSPLVMLWFSDIHGSQYNYNRLIEFKNYFNEYIQASLCTGDLVNNYYQDDFSYFTATDIMLAIGNHDVQDSTTEEHSHIGLDAYNKYFAPFISNWGVVQPTNAAAQGLCYYYKDYADRNIRLIVLDKMAWNAAQNTWLQGVLTDAITNGYSVICANHYPASIVKDTKCSFCSLYTENIGGMPTDLINSVESFIDNGGEFICHLNGHTHADYYGVIPDTKQLSITIDCAYMNYHEWNDSDRVNGEKSADCFNILSVDTYDKTIKLFRVGVDRDRWLRHKGTMCVKYDTRELLWND